MIRNPFRLPTHDEVVAIGIGAALVVASALAHAAWAPARAETLLTGPVERVVDGDGLHVGAAVIRLHGIDAPERAQACQRDGAPWACGEAASEALTKLAAGKQVACTIVDRDKYKRLIGRCWTLQPGGTRDPSSLNKTMVRTGMATAFRRYSTDYIDAEAEARAARRGLWASEFQQPADFRAASRGK